MDGKAETDASPSGYGGHLPVSSHSVCYSTRRERIGNLSWRIAGIKILVNRGNDRYLFRLHHRRFIHRPKPVSISSLNLGISRDVSSLREENECENVRKYYLARRRFK